MSVKVPNIHASRSRILFILCQRDRAFSFGSIARQLENDFTKSPTIPFGFAAAVKIGNRLVFAEGWECLGA
jgi:hypothetical protein